VPACQVAGPVCVNDLTLGECVEDDNGCFTLVEGTAPCHCPTENACDSPGETRCTDGSIEVCAEANGCSTWTHDNDCAASGFLCEMRSGAARCVCPPALNNAFYLDPRNGGSPASGPFATGSRDPAVCRFRDFSDARDASIAATNEPSTATAEIIAVGATATQDVVIQLPNGGPSRVDQPLVPFNVTFRAADAPMGPDVFAYRLLANGSRRPLAPGVVRAAIDVFGELRDFELIQPSHGEVGINCTGRLTHVHVGNSRNLTGPGRMFDHGVHVAGGCTAEDVRISGVETALQVGCSDDIFHEAEAALDHLAITNVDRMFAAYRKGSSGQIFCPMTDPPIHGDMPTKMTITNSTISQSGRGLDLGDPSDGSVPDPGDLIPIELVNTALVDIGGTAVDIFRGSVTITGTSRIERTGGVHVRDGILSVTGAHGNPVLILENTDGISSNQGGTVTLRDALLQGNLHGGASLGGTVSITNSEFSGNGDGTRAAGGLVLNAATAVLAGNRFHNNTGAQIATNAALIFRNGAGGCDAATNSIYGYSAPDFGLSATGTGYTVDAQFVAWGNATPVAGRDFVAATGVTVNAGHTCAAVP
jgi:hypothetical protein